MKTLLLTLMFCLFNLTTTEIIGKYQIESNRSADTLELKKDGTYKYQSRGDSCWTWTDITGTWEFNDEILILSHNYSYQEETIEYNESIKPYSNNIITFVVKDNFGNLIPEFEIKYWCENNIEQIQKTDKNGIAEFKKCGEIIDKQDIVGIGIKYLTNGNQTTETNSLYKNSNYIVLTMNSEPKTINKKEKYRFEYNNGKLKSIEFPYVYETSIYKKL
jgi:hypothetical protein